ncbi:MAG: LysM peptidoglycan-binding domain-containing protein [Streptosporangiales bacterium]|nr:LysM peptidoglycan-binding domain-containing protein [Streptosporangiales bacterium]
MSTGPKLGRAVHAIGLIAGLGVAVAALAWASAGPLHAVTTGQALDYDAALGGCAAAVSWLVLSWFTGCVALTLLARLPGAAGRCAGGLAARLTPAVFRRLLEASLGVTLVLATSAQVAAAATHGRVHTATVAGLLADPTPPTPDRPDVRPRHHDARLVRVRPGDSLWRIARTHMSGRPTTSAVTREWHRWYAANRSLIGPVPDHIVPGQRLRPPAP